MRRSGWRLWVPGALLLLALAGAARFWVRPVDLFWDAIGLQMRLNGGESHWAIVEGMRIHYYAMGPDTGPAVVLIHGLGGRAEDWVNLAPYLRRAGYRVYLPDLPGFGQSEQPAAFSYSVRDQAGRCCCVSRRDGLQARGPGRLVDGRVDRAARSGGAS